MTAAAEGPYKGLVPYGEEDADYFFGRDGERRIITANLMAHRLTLLYGQSGVGKSSLLRAGVARDLGALAESNVEGAGSPGFAVVVAGAWRDDPLRMLADAVRRAAEPLLAEPDPGPPQGAALAEVLAHWSERLDADLLVVLDQFEEYFLYHGHEGTGPGSFPWQLAQAVNHPTLRARFLVSLREDALASLDAFKGLIPRLFENYLRVGHLDPRSAREAVVKPLATFSAEHPGRAVKAEPGLVDAVLAEIQGGKVALGDRGHGALRRDEAAAGEIEAPYLQLVMTRLWREEMRLKSGTLRLQTYRKLGGAARIVSTHLDEVMKGLSRADRETASRLFRYLVTPGGAKIAHTAETLAYYTRVPEARVTRTLKLLAGQRIRILRESDGAYQIFHDVMGPAVLGWRQRHAAARRERNLGIGGTGLMAAVVAGLVFFALRPAAARVERAHERLVAGLLEQDREVLADRRYVPADSGRALGDAGSGDTLTARFRAAAPGDYVVDLACGGGCRDAGLRAFGAGNAAALAVGRPTQPARAAGGGQDGHAGATLEMIGVEPGEYRLRFTLSCGRRTCPYGYRVYHRAPLPDSASVVLAAADRASVAVAQARRTGDPRPLLTAWTGAALADQAGQVAELRRAGRYEESRLLEQEICALAVSPDRRTATARVMERWEVTRHHPDSVPRHTVDPPAVQDMTLRWEPGGWKIAAITFRSGQRC